MDLKYYKDVLGKPSEGFHKNRINIFGLSFGLSFIVI